MANVQTGSDTKHDIEVSQQEAVPNAALSWTAEEEAKLVRKIDLYIMAPIWLMYLFSYMDRTNIANAKTAGMAEDLNLSSNEYSVALVSFFVTYVVFEAPSNMLLVRTRPSRYLPTMMAIWGLLTCCMAAVQTYSQLVGLRLLVGIFESAFAPGVLLILSSWYTKRQQSVRFSVYISAAILSGAFGGLFAGAITGGLEMVGGIRGWRWLFIIEGLSTIAVALGATFVLLDFPATTASLTDRERLIAIARLNVPNVAERKASLGIRQSFLAACRQWSVGGNVLGYMVIVGSSTLSYFYPTLVKGLGYTNSVEAQYHTVPIYAVAFVAAAFSGYTCDKIPDHRGFVIAGWLSLSLSSSIVVCVVYDYKVRYAMLILMAAGLWASNAIALSFASSSFGSMNIEVRAVALALVNSMGNLAQIYGSWLFPSNDATKYLMGFGVISGMLMVGISSYIVLQVYMRRTSNESGSAWSCPRESES